MSDLVFYGFTTPTLLELGADQARCRALAACEAASALALPCAASTPMPLTRHCPLSGGFKEAVLMLQPFAPTRASAGRLRLWHLCCYRISTAFSRGIPPRLTPRPPTKGEGDRGARLETAGLWLPLSLILLRSLPRRLERETKSRDGWRN